MNILSISRSTLQVKTALLVNTQPLIDSYIYWLWILSLVFRLMELWIETRGVLHWAVGACGASTRHTPLISLMWILQLLNSIRILCLQLILLLRPTSSLYLLDQSHLVLLLYFSFILFIILKHHSKYWAATLLILIRIIVSLLSFNIYAWAALLFKAFMALS